MAARLTDKQKKKIIADYVEMGSYNAVAKKHKISATTVKNTVLANGETVKKCEDKKEQNTADILSYMESKRGIVCEIIGKGLTALNDEAKLKAAAPSQITTALGTLIDKFTFADASRMKEEQTENTLALADIIRHPVPDRNVEDFENEPTSTIQPETETVL